VLEGKPTEKHKKKFKALFETLGIKDPTCKEVMVLGQADRAMKGDTFAFRELRNLIGEEDEAPSNSTQDKVVIDFDTFCTNAGYFLPYPQQREMIDFAYGGGIRMVEASRKYGKTDYVEICGAAYEIYKNSKRTFLIINKDRDKAATAVSEIGNVLKANGVTLEVDSTRRIIVKGLIGKQESAKALSTRMSPKQNHPDYIICDGIVDVKDKYSEAERLLYGKIFKVG
jgi:hypothetical protein